MPAKRLIHTGKSYNEDKYNRGKVEKAYKKDAGSQKEPMGMKFQGIFSHFLSSLSS
jgi:hypothetical protein